MRLLTVDQAAEVLSVGKRTVYRMVKGNELRAVYLPPSQRLRIREDDLDQFIEAHTHLAPDADAETALGATSA